MGYMDTDELNWSVSMELRNTNTDETKVLEWPFVGSAFAAHHIVGDLMLTATRWVRQQQDQNWEVVNTATVQVPLEAI